MNTLPIHRLAFLLAIAILISSTLARELLALVGASPMPSTAHLATIGPAQAEATESMPTVTLDAPSPRRLMPTVGGSLAGEIHTAAFSYDPTSTYDQKGANAPRGFTAQAPAE